MAQESVWDKEYQHSKLLTKENKPQADVVRFVHWLKKEQNVTIEKTCMIDLGSGTGRNSFYFAEMGARVVGLEISRTAVEIAETYAREAQQSGTSADEDVSSTLEVKYIKQSIGEKFPFEDASFDTALDVTSSNSLTESERDVFLAETHRVLCPSGFFFTKALCLEGDANAKHLVKHFPGSEPGTYIMPELGVTERVWTKADLLARYKPYFTILHIEKKTSYSRMNDRSYKRNFWICYMQKK